MTILLLLLITIGFAPLAVGVVLLRPSLRWTWPRVRVGSVLLIALAFNLTFFWQELWLVIPKAFTPGLHPILYHNNHDWTGWAPTVELLQGTGALATLASGLAFLGGLALTPRVGATWRLFLFWMAFEGLYQSLTQLAIGTLLSGNDVGRALAYLHVGAAGRWALLGVAVTTMALAGAFLVHFYPFGGNRPTESKRIGASLRDRSSGGARLFAVEIPLTAMLAIVLIAPFRIPRDIVEVALIPLFVNLVGAGWLALGAALVTHGGTVEDGERVGVVGPALVLGLTLVLFQLVLRPGVAF